MSQSPPTPPGYPNSLAPHPSPPSPHLAAGLRLVSNSLTTENAIIMQGRLEVQGPNNTWSTVCDDGFSDVAASTVCRQVRTAGPACWRPAARQGPLQALQVFKTATNQRGCNLSSLPQLGLSSTGFALPFAAYGQGSGPILYDDVVCTGSEATLQQCRRAAPKNVDCEWLPLSLFIIHSNWGPPLTNLPLPHWPIDGQLANWHPIDLAHPR